MFTPVVARLVPFQNLHLASKKKICPRNRVNFYGPYLVVPCNLSFSSSESLTYTSTALTATYPIRGWTEPRAPLGSRCWDNTSLFRPASTRPVHHSLFNVRINKYSLALWRIVSSTARSTDTLLPMYMPWAPTHLPILLQLHLIHMTSLSATNPLSFNYISNVPNSHTFPIFNKI